MSVKINGKIVVSNSLRPYIVTREASKLGSVGMIIISDSPFGTIRKLVTQMGYEDNEDLGKFGSSIPGVIINMSDGNELLSIMSSSKTTAIIEHDSTRQIKKSKNIIGCIEGSSDSKEEIVIGAHYDTQEGIKGAWDNATGCASLLEFCRLFSENRPCRSITFCAFGCEEIGLFGSTYYVNKRKEKLKDIVSYINLDSTSSDTSYIRRVLASENVLKLVLKIISDNSKWKVNQYRPFSKIDHEQDSAEFFKNGVNCIWISEEGNPYFHTVFDNLDSINFSKLEESAGLSFLISYYLANAKLIDLKKFNK